MDRVFSLADFIRPSEGDPVRSVMLETPDAVIVIWHLAPGQIIAPHVHPGGQDTWTVISGEALYLRGEGVEQPLTKGNVAVARRGEVHGARNTGDEPFVFVSVVAPGDAGYSLA